MTKRVKAWAILNKHKGIAYDYSRYCVFMQEEAATKDLHTEEGETVVRCTIVFDEPKKRTTK